MCERELETEQNCNIFTPTLVAIIAFHFSSPGLLNRGHGGQTSLGHVPQSNIFTPTTTTQSGAWGPTLLGAGFLYRILSPTGLVSNWFDLQLQQLNRGPECPLCWVLAFSTASCLQLTDYLSSPSYIIVHAHHLLVGVTIALIQPIHGQGYNSDIPRPDAPVIYTGAFTILTARSGRRPIYNTSLAI